MQTTERELGTNVRETERSTVSPLTSRISGFGQSGPQGEGCHA